MLDVLIGLFDASLNAQGSSASGELILPTEAVNLTGTYSGGTFTVSGGGYSLTAAVSGTSLSGSGTGPQGSSMNVSPQPPLNAAPAPSNAAGVYGATYSFIAPTRSRSWQRDTGIVREDCNFSTSISGELILELKSAASGSYTGILFDDWRESDGPPGSCNPRLVATPDPYTEFRGESITRLNRTEAAVSATAANFAWVERGPLPNGSGTHSRSVVVTGVVSGATVVARFSRTRSWSGPRGEFLDQLGGYQTSMDITLVKR
jgi:hypothetical protein